MPNKFVRSQLNRLVYKFARIVQEKIFKVEFPEIEQERRYVPADSEEKAHKEDGCEACEKNVCFYKRKRIRGECKSYLLTHFSEKTIEAKFNGLDEEFVREQRPRNRRNAFDVYTQ